CRDVGIDDRVGETADARDNRHAPIAQPIELGKSAGLEAGGNDDRIASALHYVCERLVIADHHPDPARKLRGQGEERRFPTGLPAAKNSKSDAGANDVLVGDPCEKIDAFLPGQSADEDKERRAVRLKPEPPLDYFAVLPTVAQLAR